MVERTLSQARPFLLGAAALGAGALALGLFKLAGRRPPRRRVWALPDVPAQPSMLSTIFRSVLASAAASLAGHFMEKLQRSLEPKLAAARHDDLPGPRVAEARQP